ncbi:MAG: ATP-binding protein [Pseudorhizobium sp.]
MAWRRIWCASSGVANLLNNAAKSTPNGGRIEVKVNVTQTVCQASVTDDGLGLTPQALSALAATPKCGGPDCWPHAAMTLFIVDATEVGS